MFTFVLSLLVLCLVRSIHHSSDPTLVRAKALLVGLLSLWLLSRLSS